MHELYFPFQYSSLIHAYTRASKPTRNEPFHPYISLESDGKPAGHVPTWSVLPVGIVHFLLSRLPKALLDSEVTHTGYYRFRSRDRIVCFHHAFQLLATGCATTSGQPYVTCVQLARIASVDAVDACIWDCRSVSLLGILPSWWSVSPKPRGLAKRREPKESHRN